jgi:hypothetical protein
MRPLSEQEQKQVTGGNAPGYEDFVLQNSTSCLKPAQGLKTVVTLPGAPGWIMRVFSMFE